MPLGVAEGDERPRATDGRPYEVLETLINQGLLACLFDSNCNGNCHTNHGVVTCAIISYVPLILI